MTTERPCFCKTWAVCRDDDCLYFSHSKYKTFHKRYNCLIIELTLNSRQRWAFYTVDNVG